MTAYAYRDGILAVDSLVCSGGFRVERMNKVAVLDDKSLLVGAGKVATIRHVIRQLENSTAYDQITGFEKDDRTFVHRFTIDGDVMGWCSEGFHSAINEAWVASGEWAFLHGALAMGHSAKQAVIAACWHSTGCGFPIHIWERGEWVETISECDAVAQAIKPVFATSQMQIGKGLL